MAAAASRSSPDAAGGGVKVGRVGSEPSGGIEPRAMIPEFEVATEGGGTAAPAPTTRGDDGTGGTRPASVLLIGSDVEAPPSAGSLACSQAS